PLRERREDVPLLVSHFVRRYNHEFGKHLEGLAPEALRALCAYDWPGNVRELQNVVERSVVLVESGIIGLDDLPLELSVVASGPDSGAAVPLNEASDRFERQMVLRMLDRVEGNVSEAARALRGVIGRNRSNPMAAHLGPLWRPICFRLPPVGALMERDSKLLKGEVHDQDLRCRAPARVVPARAPGDRVRHLRLLAALPGDRHGRWWRWRRVTGHGA